MDNPTSSGSLDQQQKKTLARPQKDQIVNCPRCNSVNTKFCYYNNYSLSQPRYFCKTCRRYWTAGGSLRNVPVGGGSRKNRRSSATSSSSVLTTSVQAQAQASSGSVANNLHQGHDLNLSFPTNQTTTHDDHLHLHHQYPNPTFTTTSTKPNFSIDHLSNTKLLPHHHHHLQNPNSNNISPLLPPMGLFKNTLLSHDHSSREMMSSLMNPTENHLTNNSNNSSIFSSTGFPQIHQDQFKSSNLNFSLDGFSNDNNHEGYAASCLQLGVQQQRSHDDHNAGGVRLLFPFNHHQENMNNNKEHQKQVPSASTAAASSDHVVLQFDHDQHNINRSSSSASVQGGVGGGNGGDHNNVSSAGFWTGMLSGGSW